MADNDAPAVTSTSEDPEDALLDRAADPEESLDRLARTDTIAGKPAPGPGPSRAKAPDAPAQPAPAPPAPAPAQVDDDVRARLVDARLRVIPGETREAALTRLTDHYAGRSTAHYAELKQIRESQERINQFLEPMLRAWHQQQQAKRQDEVMAEIPDKETDPQGYLIWLQEQTLLAQQERETEEEERLRLEQEEADAVAAEEAEIETVLSADEATVGQLEAAVESDPEAREAYRIMTNAMLQSARDRYPNATPEQHLEFVTLAQMLDMRQMLAAGHDIPTRLKATAANLRRMFGVGEAPVPQSPAPAPPQVVSAHRSSPTAERLAAASQSAAARGVVTGPPPSSAPSGEGLDITKLDEDTFVELALDGKITDEMIQRTYGKTSRYGG